MVYYSTDSCAISPSASLLCESTISCRLVYQPAQLTKLKFFDIHKQFANCCSNTIYSGGSRISHGGGVDPLGRHRPPMWALFGENVCKNERIGSTRVCTWPSPRSANDLQVQFRIW